MASASDIWMTPEHTFNTAVELISEHQFLPELSTFHLALALHTAAPRIEAAYSWYSSNVDESRYATKHCSAWVQWQGQGYCDSEGLGRAIEDGVSDM